MHQAHHSETISMSAQARRLAICFTAMRLDEETAGNLIGGYAAVSMLEIRGAHFTEPDSDNDTRPEVQIEFTNDSGRTIELMNYRLFLFDSQGLIVESQEDEQEDFLEGGEAWNGEISSSFIKAEKVEDATFKATVELQACASSFHELGRFQLKPEAGAAGSGDAFDLGDGLKLLSLAVSVSAPDDDQDVTVEIKALMKNSGQAYYPKAILAGKITRSGREIDELSNYSDPIFPGQELVLLSGSTYVKSRRLSGAQIDVTLSLFPVVHREVAEAEIDHW